MSQTTTARAEPSAGPTAPTLPGNPYVGPLPFTEEDAEKFFGRDFEARELTSLLNAERIVLLYSPSGAGKTSLIQARLLAALRGRFRVLPVVRLNRSPAPGDGRQVGSPNRYVESVLRCLDLTDPGPARTRGPADPDAGGTEPAGPALVDFLDARPHQDGEKAEVLIFDQFEEVFTLDPTDLEKKFEFFRQLGEALGHGDHPEGEAGRTPPRWALFAMREEYLGALDPYLASLPNRLATRFRLGLLDRKKTYAAIQGPAARAGVTVAPDVAHHLFRSLCRRHVLRPGRQEPDVVEGHYVDPVHLQIVCQRLWGYLPVGKALVTADDLKGKFDASGRDTVDTLLADYFSDTVKAVAARSRGRVKERDIRLWVDQYLITRNGLRGQVLQGSPEARRLPDEALQALLDACLLREEERNEAKWLELAHDRLIRPIKLNNDAWYERNLSPVQMTARAWDKAGRPPSLLLYGRTLAEAEAWAKANPEELTELDREFLDKGVAKRKGVYLRIGISAVLAAALLGIVVVLVINRSTRHALTKSRAYHLAAKAQLASETDPEQALLLAYHAGELDSWEGSGSPVREILIDILSKAGGRALFGHNGPIAEVDLTKRWVVTAGQDRTIRLWPRDRFLGKGRILPDTVKVLGGPHGHEKAIIRFDLNEAEDMLATASVDKTVRVWDLEHPDAAPAILEGPTKTVTRVAFFEGAGSDWVCAGGQDNEIYFWHLTKRALGGPGPTVLTPCFSFPAHEGRITAIFFDPERRVLVSGAEDGTVRVWPVDRIMDRFRAGSSERGRSGDASRVSHLLMGHKPKSAVTDVEFAYNKDGKGGREVWLVTASDDQTARLWRLEDFVRRDPPVAVVDRKAGEESAAIRAYRDRIVDIAEVSVPITASGHRIIDIDVDQGGRILVTGDISGDAYIWRLSEMIAAFPERKKDPRGFQAKGSEKYATRLVGHTNSITDITISPDGLWVATASSDNTARLWEVPGPEGRTEVKYPDYTLVMENRVGAVKFSSPSGGEGGLALITGCDDETARVWKMSDLDRERDELLVQLPRRANKRKNAFEELSSSRLAERCKNVLRRRLDGAEIEANVKELKEEFPDLFERDYKFE